MVDTSKAKQSVAKIEIKPMSKQVAQVRQNITILHQALKSIMKKDVHFGIIPGCQKPSLYKPGAEVIMALFKLSCNPEVQDLSSDGEIRYIVKAQITTRDGVFVGSGIGECSSKEEKYMWRRSICEEEFDSFQETSRRIKFAKDKHTKSIIQIKQVRTEPHDLANTILKMAKKRALIDAVLTATGASDIFSQDIEDLPEEFISQNVEAVISETQDQEIEQKENIIKEVRKCQGCDIEIEERVHKYSTERLGKSLCRNCQKQYKS